MKSKLFILYIFLFFSASYCAECSGYIVTLKERTPFSSYSCILFDAEKLYDIENIYDNIYYAENDDVLNQLISDDMVENYEDDMIVYLFDDVSEYNDTYFEKQWYWDIVKADIIRNNTKEGASVRIGMIDSGICYDHPDMIGANIEPGYDVINDEPSAEAEFYHGCFAAGIIAARANNNTGIVGMCDNVTIVPIKCFTGKTAYLRYIIEGIYKAVDDYDCDIINMSLGVKSESESLKAAVDYAAGRNVIMVASVGNSYNSTVYYPAGSENVIGVGAVAMSDGKLIKAPYSQTNNSVYITAPGSAVFSTDYSDDGDNRSYTYSSRNGTSFASPMVSSFLAAAKTIYPQLTIDDAFEILRESAEDLGEEGYDETYGYGVINMEKGINYLIDSRGLDNSHKTPEPSESPELTEPTETPGTSEPPAPSEIPEKVNIYLRETEGMLTLSADTNDSEGILIVALYDENEVMTNIKICNISLAYNNELIYNIDNSKYKIMLWKDLKSMIPVEFSIIDEYHKRKD